MKIQQHEETMLKIQQHRDEIMMELRKQELSSVPKGLHWKSKN
jgi:hypothetical protein